MKKLPLVVDLDGTLTYTDTLMESITAVLKRNPFNLLRMFLWLFKGRAGFKIEVASRYKVDARYLPYVDPLIEYLRLEKKAGRRIILATAAHESIAEAVSAHLDLFDDVIATRDGHNLKGSKKLQVISETIDGKFVYAGDSKADLPIWRGADAAILVGVSQSVATSVSRLIPIEKSFEIKTTPRSWIKLLRVHQWIKNLLIFFPLFISFQIPTLDKSATIFLAYLSFSLTASASYVLNDIWDLESDRVHPEKRNRPLANGAITLSSGIVAAGILLLLAVGMARCLPPVFLAMLILYLAFTTAYSLVLKRYVLIDVIALATLYTYRILIGGAVLNVPISAWLLEFSLLFFLSLALMKRCVELLQMQLSNKENCAGRGYHVTDLQVIWPLGVGAGLAAVVVFGLFINSPETQSRYGTPEFLWLASIGITYWMSRLWLKTSRNEMHDDPVVFAASDTGTRVSFMATFAMVLIAKYSTIDLSFLVP